ncbi:MAG: thioesterase family protein, partial [Pseudomonadota bacterium]
APWECDFNGHMNVRFFVAKFDEGTWNFTTRLGMGRNYVVDRKLGCMSVEQNVRYKRELLVGDALYVESWLSEVADKRLILNHAMYHQESGDLSAEMKITAIHVDLEKRRACPFPDDIRPTLDKWVVRE